MEDEKDLEIASLRTAIKVLAKENASLQVELEEVYKRRAEIVKKYECLRAVVQAEQQNIVISQ